MCTYVDSCWYASCIAKVSHDSPIKSRHTTRNKLAVSHEKKESENELHDRNLRRRKQRCLAGVSFSHPNEPDTTTLPSSASTPPLLSATHTYVIVGWIVVATGMLGRDAGKEGREERERERRCTMERGLVKGGVGLLLAWRRNVEQCVRTTPFWTVPSVTQSLSSPHFPSSFTKTALSLSLSLLDSGAQATTPQFSPRSLSRPTIFPDPSSLFCLRYSPRRHRLFLLLQRYPSTSSIVFAPSLYPLPWSLPLLPVSPLRLSPRPTTYPRTSFYPRLEVNSTFAPPPLSFVRLWCCRLLPRRFPLWLFAAVPFSPGRLGSRHRICDVVSSFHFEVVVLQKPLHSRLILPLLINLPLWPPSIPSCCASFLASPTKCVFRLWEFLPFHLSRAGFDTLMVSTRRVHILCELI